QAVKHRFADMLVDLDSLRNAVYYAAWALERDAPDASAAVSVAKAYASDAAVRIAKSAVQVHGGVGFTWEHDLHLYLKRLKADEHAFGDANAHRERIAALLQARMAQG
ncbi:MAG TPA: acyl-CoA dehydrogenase family protein, partial [Actinomycetota bacterium]|nr:acyl-CoA dehydrogenase family protein [Actinomycetota bacterium]